jgi:hypothetical protein
VLLTRKQLSKDEEASTPDAEVTREDQDKINAFSRLHNREKKYEEELERKQACRMSQILFMVDLSLTTYLLERERRSRRNIN